MSTSSLVAVSNGRKVQVEEYGDLTGAPAIWLHGAFSSRLEAGWLDEPARELGLRILSLDRPGCGGSDPVPGLTPVGYGHHVGEVLDALGLDQVAVGGLSNGGMLTMAIAATLPERVLRAVPLNPSSPVADARARKSLSLQARMSYRYLDRNKDKLFDKLANPQPPGRIMTFISKRSNHDSHLLAEHGAAWSANTAEALRQPSSGYLPHELTMAAGPWGFDHRAVSVPVTLVSGEKDGGLGYAKVWAQELPQGRLVLTPGGHGNIMNPLVGRRVAELLSGRS